MENGKKLLVIDGLDGSGKATQAKLLCESLRERGTAVRAVSFPDYDSPSSSLVKMYLAGQFGTHPEDVNAFAASSFYAVDRFASFKRDWKGDWVRGVIIADRYTTSNAIHQCSKLPEAQWDGFLDWLFDYEYRLLGIPAPSGVIFLRVDPAVSQRLLDGRYGGDAEKKDLHESDRAYLARCQRAADYCAARLSWHTVECCRDGEMRPKEDIAREVFALASELLAENAPAFD